MLLNEKALELLSKTIEESSGFDGHEKLETQTARLKSMMGAMSAALNESNASRACAEMLTAGFTNFEASFPFFQSLYEDLSNICEFACASCALAKDLATQYGILCDINKIDEEDLPTQAQCECKSEGKECDKKCDKKEDSKEKPNG